MAHFPETRQSLLIRIQQNEREAWHEFAAIYGPIVYRLARGRGLQHADANDLQQQVLSKVSRSIQRFKPGRDARFRTWISTICRNSMIDELRKRRDVCIDDLQMQAALDAMTSMTDEDVDLERRRQIFRWAGAKARDQFSGTSWNAFWKTAVLGASVQNAAEELGISVGAVYTARSRIMQFLKQKVQEYDHAEMQ